MRSILKSIVIVFLVCSLSISAKAQNFQNILNDAQKEVSTVEGDINNILNKKGGGTGSLSSADISEGLRQALQVGAQNATNKVSATNGFFGNALIKILMPPEAQKVENTLRELGMGSKVDEAILAMNRGAEDASSKALPIFVNAIRGMSIEDGLSILRGSNDAATQFLKRKTSTALAAAFLPVIRGSLDKVSATRYWTEIFRIYNALPTTTKVNTDLPSYVTDKALAGVFVYIAEEEGKIRANPAARVTDILKKVFGSK